MPAIAQNALKNTINEPAQPEIQERKRIQDERAVLIQTYDAQRQACYQQFNVNACLTDARDAHNEQLRDLKRQEVALNDAQRKRKAADRQREIDERNSPERQLRQAQRRGKAMQEFEKRELNNAQRQTERAGKPTAPVPTASESVSTSTRPAAQAAPSVARLAAPVSPVNKPISAGKNRELQAQQRRDKAAQREAQRTKPPSAGLPIPQ
ncbi:MAG: hypothetical protein HC765_06415 [Brachymonas sp.]|nr:hypothetical protein [Brachymonas sp.]